MTPDALTQSRIGALSVPVLGLGTAPLAGLFQPVSEADARATVQSAFDHGVRLFDTAPQYGYGMAERRLGEALRDPGLDGALVSTKVGRLLQPRTEDDSRPDDPFKTRLPNDAVFDFSYDGAMRSLEESLGRLGRDRVDIVLVHDPDDHLEEALDGAYRALDELRAQGVVAAVGAGMNNAAPLAWLVQRAELDCVLIAGRYTLLERSALPELLPACEERGTAVIVGGALNSGILAGPRPGATFDYQPAPPEVLQRAEQIEAVCAGFGVALRDAALQFPLAHPQVAAMVVGCRSPDEVQQNAASLSAPIPPELWDELRARRLLEEGVPTP